MEEKCNRNRNVIAPKIKYMNNMGQRKKERNFKSKRKKQEHYNQDIQK